MLEKLSAKVLLISALLAALPGVAQTNYYQNPVIPGDHADPTVARIGDEFWSSCTSGHAAHSFPLYHSKDLVHWERAGSVFTNHPAWAVDRFWAPEMVQYKNLVRVFYTARSQSNRLSVAEAVAEKPGGPYRDLGPIVAQPNGSIDASFVLDEHGAPYLIWKEDGNAHGKPTPIWAQPMDENATRVIGKPTELIRNDVPWEGYLVEGPFIIRRGGWFYLFYSGPGCCGGDCNYSMGVARSRALLGPWEKNPANPILAANDVWRCPGHGTVVEDGQGRYWLLHHAYEKGEFSRGRQALLEEVVFGSDGWPTINNGLGSALTAPAPFASSPAGSKGAAMR